MARRLSWGTPGGRADRYFHPRPAYLRLLLGLGLAGAALGLFAILELGGRWLAPLRIPIMPGGMIPRHTAETGDRCEACHAAPRVSNLRCQRCHDEAGTGRMTHAAHAGRREERLRVGDAAASASVARLECVRCHVEHRGRQEGASARLVEVSDGQCVSCHGSRRRASDGERPSVTGLASHPEFAVKRSSSAEPQLVGAYFSHRKHFVFARKALQTRQPAAAASDETVCRQCHALSSGRPGHRDFAPLESGAHCFSCHDHQSDLDAGAIPASEASFGDSANPCQAGSDEQQGFDCGGGQVRKLSVEHRDPWIRTRVDRLRRQLYPEAHEREGAELLARQYRLARRLFLGQMLATLEASELEARLAGVDAELLRFADRARTAPESVAAAQRVDEVLQALAASGHSDAELARQLEGLRGKGPPQQAAAFEIRRAELLDLLDAVSAAEPALRGRAQELRLRLLLATPGDDAFSSDRRAAEQRREDRERLLDELQLRRRGLTRRAPTQRAAEDLQRAAAALGKVRTRLAELRAVDGERAALPQERERKERALEALVGKARDSGCAHCHVIEEATFLPVKMAWPILSLAEFRHEAHLGAATPRPGLMARMMGRGQTPAQATLSGNCESCHAGMKESQEAQDLHLEGIASCRECHGVGLSDKCQLCHRYHPPARF